MMIHLRRTDSILNTWCGKTVPYNQLSWFAFGLGKRSAPKGTPHVADCPDCLQRYRETLERMPLITRGEGDKR
jgi:hypothetical protein